MASKYNIFYCGGRPWLSGKWMERTGSDPHGIRIMTEKDQIYPIFIENLYFAAGNILKQDLLSLGGDAVVHKFFVNAKVEHGDVLLLGTAKHYRYLQTKMYAQHWGLKELGEDLRVVMENLLLYREYMAEKEGQPKTGQPPTVRKRVLPSTAAAAGALEEVTEEVAVHLPIRPDTEPGHPYPGWIPLEELMTRLPLNRAKNEGFIPITILGLDANRENSEYFFPTISRGYVIL